MRPRLQEIPHTGCDVHPIKQSKLFEENSELQLHERNNFSPCGYGEICLWGEMQTRDALAV
jgi:hypothetical protein